LEEERVLVNRLVASCDKFKRFGIDFDQDQKHWPELDKVCSELESRAPYLAGPETKSPADFVVGDWMVLGTTSNSLRNNQGLTGIGKMPFTNPHKFGLFFRYGSVSPVEVDAEESSLPQTSVVVGGNATVAEVLEVFGKPSLKNELRGLYRWPSRFKFQQVYSEGDGTLQ
jgi:hypothetical protein